MDKLSKLKVAGSDFHHFIKRWWVVADASKLQSYRLEITTVEGKLITKRVLKFESHNEAEIAAFELLDSEIMCEAIPVGNYQNSILHRFKDFILDFWDSALRILIILAVAEAARLLITSL